MSLLNSSDTDVQYYCTTALSNIAVDASNRRKLITTESKLVELLVRLMDSTSPKVQCQSALALRNLASDGPSYDLVTSALMIVHRAVPSRDRQVRRFTTSTSPAAFTFPTSHSLSGCLRSEHFHTSQ